MSTCLIGEFRIVYFLSIFYPAFEMFLCYQIIHITIYIGEGDTVLSSAKSLTIVSYRFAKGSDIGTHIHFVNFHIAFFKRPPDSFIISADTALVSHL